MGVNWDEVAEEAAQPFGDCRSHDMRFVHGAQWQREQLRTPEAVERIAEAMFEADGEDIEDFEKIGRPTFSNLHKEGRDYYRERAERAIAALLGED